MRGLAMARTKIRIGIVGVGSCSSSLVQGSTFYEGVAANEPVPGLMNVELGGYRPEDIEIVCAFDVARGKVGKDVAEAIFALPNNTTKFADVAPTGVKVKRGPTLDGIGKYVRGPVQESPEFEVDVAEILSSSGAEVLVSYLPVGSDQATVFYAEQALAANCAF